MKKIYQQPEMCVMHVQHQGLICQSMTGMESNADLHFVGSGSGESRVKRQGDHDDWEDWEDWEKFDE